MQREKAKMFAAFTVGIVLCGTVLTGVYFWILRPEQEPSDVPPLAAIGREEARQILQSHKLKEDNASTAANRTKFFGRNIQFLALKKKHRDEGSPWHFTEADAPIMEVWLKRHWKLVWTTLLQEADSFDLQLALDDYDLQDATCTWRYREKPLTKTSWHILENSMAITMTLTIKEEVRKEELEWPMDFHWGFIASVKLQFVMERDKIRSVMIDVKDQNRRAVRDPIDLAKIREDMTRAVQAVFRSDGHPGWVYLSKEKETEEYHWKGIP